MSIFWRNSLSVEKELWTAHLVLAAFGQGLPTYSVSPIRHSADHGGDLLLISAVSECGDRL